MKKLCLILILSVCVCLMASCSSGSEKSYDEAPTVGNSAAPDASYGSNSESGIGVKEDSAVTSDRKLIRDVTLQVETKGYDALIADLNDRVSAMGGYIEQSQIGGSAYDAERSERRATITYRIPSDQLDEFLAHVGENCNVTERSEQARDVTLTYVDLESRIKTLEAERDALLAMLETADTTAEILSIRSQLNDVIYQYESATAQLRALSEQVDYSKVSMTIMEVLEYTEAEAEDDRSMGEKIADGFVRSCKDIASGFTVLGAYLLINSPYLILLGVIFGGGGVILYLCLTRKARAAKRAAKKQSTGENSAESPTGSE